MSEMEMMMRGYRLTLAEILYHMPDHPGVLQTFTWQDFDQAPRFPRLKTFLDFWTGNIDGKLHSVRIAAKGIVSATDMRYAGVEFQVH